MLLFIGLGNIGAEFKFTRHNVGFMLIDWFKASYSIDSLTTKFDCEISVLNLNGYRMMLVKPLTYMNLSGTVVQKVIKYYKVQLPYIYVVHDDINLPFCKIKIKQGGSSGGHNGIKSLDNYIGNQYFRIRIGVGKPNNNLSIANFVTSNFSNIELDYMNSLLSKIVKNYFLIITNQLTNFYNQCKFDFSTKI